MTFLTIPRLWRVVLVVSLALNLAVLGVALGRVLERSDRDRGARVAGPAAPLVRALDEADRDALVEDLRRGPRPPRGRGLEPVLEAVRAQPFDAKVLRSALAEARRHGTTRLDRAEGALIERLAQMTPQARAAYADRLAKGFRRGR